MAKETLIQKGFIVEQDPDRVRSLTAMFSLDKWFKKLARKLGIQYADCCENDVPTGFPTRLSADKSKYEYFNSDTFTWEDSPI